MSSTRSKESLEEDILKDVFKVTLRSNEAGKYTYLAGLSTKLNAINNMLSSFSLPSVPHSTTPVSEMVPCELCNQLIPMSQIVSHQSFCNRVAPLPQLNLVLPSSPSSTPSSSSSGTTNVPRLDRSILKTVLQERLMMEKEVQTATKYLVACFTTSTEMATKISSAEPTAQLQQDILKVILCLLLVFTNSTPRPPYAELASTCSLLSKSNKPTCSTLALK